jgi:UDP-N-acetylmuramate dehydrogenase
MKIFNDFSLKPYNTFGLNYNCAAFIEVEFAEEIYSINKMFELNKAEHLIIGQGSNILFTKDFDGIVIHPIFDNFSVKSQDHNFLYLEVEAGKNWNELVRYTVGKNLGGIENLVSIPGLAGAAPIQNIGAYGQEIKDVIEFIHFFDFNDNIFKVFNNQQCRFDYRNSIFKQELKNKIFITSIEMKLKKNPTPVIDYGNVKDELIKSGIENPTVNEVCNIIANIRKNKLPSPMEIGNAGSFFKNPIVSNSKFEELKKSYPNIPFFEVSDKLVKIPAAWLIEKIGFKGKTIGNVGTYKNQPLVIVNFGNASGNEILDFANEIRSKIFTEFGIELETEVNII